MVIESLLGPAMHAALTGGTMGVASKNVLNSKSDDKTKVLGDEISDGLMSDSKKEENIDISKLSKDEKDDLLIDLAEKGVGSKMLSKISKTGFLMPALVELLSEGWLKRLVGTSQAGYDQSRRDILSSPQLNPGPDDDDDKKKKKEEKKKKVEKELEEVERKRNAKAGKIIKGQQEFQKTDPKAIAKRSAEKGLKKAGSTEWDPTAKTPKADLRQAARNALKKAGNEIEVDKKSMLRNTGEQKMEIGERAMKEAAKRGDLETYLNTHVTPAVNIPQF